MKHPKRKRWKLSLKDLERSDNYLPKIEAAINRLGGIPPGSLTEVTVGHDSWCASYKSLPCNCDPDVRVTITDPESP